MSDSRRASAEGREWWLQLQQQRTQQAGQSRRQSARRSSTGDVAALVAGAAVPSAVAAEQQPADAPPASEALGAAGMGPGMSPDEQAALMQESSRKAPPRRASRARRRSSLLKASKVLLRRMTHPVGPYHIDGSAGQRNTRVPLPSPASTLESTLGGTLDGSRLPTGPSPRPSKKRASIAVVQHVAAAATAGAPASPAGPQPGSQSGAPEPSGRAVFLRTVSQVARHDKEEQINELLEGGMLGRAKQAHAAWHAMLQQMTDIERQERQQMLGLPAGVGRRAIARMTISADGRAHTVGAGRHLPRAGAGAALTAATHRPRRAARLSLPPLVEEEGQEGEEEGAHASQDNAAAVSAAEAARAAALRAADTETAEALVSAFADPEVRRYLQQQLSILNRPGHRASTVVAAAAAVSAAAVEAAAAGGLHAEWSSRSSWAVATDGSEGGDATGWKADPVLKAWMVTRAPPDIPVRGYKPPPGRAACRLITAREMQQYYQQQKQTKGSFFRWLGLTHLQAPRRDSDASLIELMHTGFLPQERKGSNSTMRSSQRKSVVGTVSSSSLTGSLVPRIKANAWAREHTEQVLAAMTEQLKLQQEQQAAAEAAEAEAAVAAEATAEASGRQEQQAEQEGAASGSVAQQTMVKSTSRGARQGATAPVPQLQLQKVTQRWQRTAAQSVFAVGEHTARQRQEAAARVELRQQWQAVRERLAQPSKKGAQPQAKARQ